MTPLPENHHHDRLLKYWDSLRGDRDFPGENAINPDDIKDIWPSCFLVNIDAATDRLGYRYSYLGRELLKAYGNEFSDTDVPLGMMNTRTMPLIEKFDEVLRTKKPVIDTSQFINPRNLTIKYRATIAPLGYGNTISYIIGCMRWKIVVGDGTFMYAVTAEEG